ncbi:MAG: leucine-rich repeat domain-containing protein [Clostridia bacterium]|nr:leucine-rich repeat domain-containing protein [Clostridia bacterium]
MKKTKRIISIILAVMMILGAVPFAGMTAFAAETYVDRTWDGTKVVKTVKEIPANAKQITSETTYLYGNWYYVDGNVTSDSRITVNGTSTSPTHIILKDGCYLNAARGINVAKGNMLYIYAQSDETGRLFASGATDGAGIGSMNKKTDCGEITINGGQITVHAGSLAAGIGSGSEKNSGTVTINGGTVTVRGNNLGAAIGGGKGGDGGTVTINGGTVTATGGTNGSGVGIGGGTGCSSHGTLTVNGKVSIKAGSREAEAQETTVEAYTTSRDAYVSIVPIPHVHEFAETWSTNETAHWYACTADDCDITDYASCGIEDAAYAAHTWADGKCSVCGYECGHDYVNKACKYCGEEEPEFIIDKNGVLIGYTGNGGDVVIPDGVTGIGKSVFEGCENLTSVKIPDSVIIIGSLAFEDCSNLTSVTLPNGLKAIENETFMNCINLKNVTIPDSVESIGDSAFGNCTGLKNVIIPNSVEKIGVCAFSHCTGLESITISDNVTDMGARAFDECNKLTDVFVSCDSDIKAVRGIMQSYGDYNYTQFEHNFVDGVCTSCGVEEFVIENGVLVEYNGNGGDVVIPDGVTSIGKSVFEGCENLTSVKIPDSVIIIGSLAFEDCSNLTSVTLPNGLKAIENETFMNCINLKNVTIPDSVESIGDSAFGNCTGLKNVIIPNSVEKIGVCAFSHCTGLESITISDNVTDMGARAFDECNKLTDVFVSCDSDIKAVRGIMEVYGNYHYTKLNHDFKDNECQVCGAPEFDIKNGVLYAYNGNGGDVVIPDGVTEIRSAFQDTSITSVTIPNSVTKIGAKAFENCMSLTSVVIPCSVKRIGDSAFSNCTNLASITISGNVVTDVDVFDNCESLTNIYCFCDSDVESVKEFMDVYNTSDNFIYTQLDHNFVDGVCTVCGEKDAATKLAEAKTAAIAAIDAATTEYNAEYAEAAKYMINTCETVETVNHQKELLLEEMAYIDAIERAKAEIDKFVKENVPSATQELNQFKTAVNNIKKEIITADNKKEADEALANGLKALNEFVPEIHSVTATNGATVTKSLNLDKSTKYEIATVKIAEDNGIKDGKWFVYWVDQTGKIVSTYSTYSFFAVEDRTLTPVYVSPDEYETERAKAILVTDIVRADNNGDGTATLYAEHSASKAAVGGAITQHGIVYTTDASQIDNLTFNGANENVKVSAATKTMNSLSGLQRTTVKVDENAEKVYAKSYIVDADGNVVYGKLQTIDVTLSTESIDSEILVCSSFDSMLVQADEIIPTADDVPAQEETETPTIVSIITSIINAIMSLIQAIIALF